MTVVPHYENDLTLLRKWLVVSNRLMTCSKILSNSSLKMFY